MLTQSTTISLIVGYDSVHYEITIYKLMRKPNLIIISNWLT